MRRVAADRPREERPEHREGALADPLRLLVGVRDAHVLRARDDGRLDVRVQRLRRAAALGPQLVVAAAPLRGPPPAPPHRPPPAPPRPPPARPPPPPPPAPPPPPPPPPPPRG